MFFFSTVDHYSSINLHLRAFNPPLLVSLMGNPRQISPLPPPPPSSPPSPPLVANRPIATRLPGNNDIWRKKEATEVLWWRLCEF